MCSWCSNGCSSYGASALHGCGSAHSCPDCDVVHGHYHSGGASHVMVILVVVVVVMVVIAIIVTIIIVVVINVVAVMLVVMVVIITVCTACSVTQHIREHVLRIGQTAGNVSMMKKI